MATEQVPSSVPAPQAQPLQVWLARLGVSGKILAVGGLVGFVAVFLPLASISVQTPSFGGRGAVNAPGFNLSQSFMVVRDFRGMICLLGYVAALALSYVLYAPTKLDPKTLTWGAVGVGGVVALLALWLFLGTLSGSGSLGFASVSVGFGAILNVLAAGAVAAGAVLKAREEKLF